MSVSNRQILRPTTKAELKSIIKQELERQGWDADLNFIDTSLITDMSNLFDSLDIRNIKIDEWDVSNVRNMSGMFSNCWKFSCDLSSWDVSNVTDTSQMFYMCENFSSDLSIWYISNKVEALLMFVACYKMPEEYYPQFEIRTRH